MNLYLGARAKRRGGTTQLGRFPLPRNRFFIRLRLYPVAIFVRWWCRAPVGEAEGVLGQVSAVENFELRISFAPFPLSPSLLHLILSILLPLRLSIFVAISSFFANTCALSSSLSFRLSLQFLLVSAVKVLNYTGLKFGRPCGSTPRDGILPFPPRFRPVS